MTEVNFAPLSTTLSPLSALKKQEELQCATLRESSTTDRVNELDC